jgi:hypothetical protein
MIRREWTRYICYSLSFRIDAFRRDAAFAFSPNSGIKGPGVDETRLPVLSRERRRVKRQRMSRASHGVLEELFLNYQRI